MLTFTDINRRNSPKLQKFIEVFGESLPRGVTKTFQSEDPWEQKILQSEIRKRKNIKKKLPSKR